MRKEEIRAIRDRAKAENKRSKEKMLINPTTEDHERKHTSEVLYLTPYIEK